MMKMARIIGVEEIGHETGISWQGAEGLNKSAVTALLPLP